jgi:hypothetical protein
MHCLCALRGTDARRVAAACCHQATGVDVVFDPVGGPALMEGARVIHSVR